MSSTSRATSEEDASTGAAEQLPFLVTHWLSQYSSNTASESLEEQEALDRVRRATSELAGAFASLGAYGTAMRVRVARMCLSCLLLLRSRLSVRLTCFLSNARSVRLDLSILQPCLSGGVLQQCTARAQFPDVRRNWSTVPPNQLALLVQSSLSVAGATVPSDDNNNLEQRASERVVQKRTHSGGRTLQDAIPIDTDEQRKSKTAPRSMLQKPTLAGTNTDTSLAAATEIQKEAAHYMDLYLELRQKCTTTHLQILSIQRSLQHNEDAIADLDRQRTNLMPENTVAAMATLDEIKESELSSQRVIAQLQRQSSGLTGQHTADRQELVSCLQQARAAFRHFQQIRGSFRRLSQPRPRSVLLQVCARQSQRRTTVSRMQRALLGTPSLEHPTTINTHLQYPVYCLRFDRTGQYFISGADDYLVRVFFARSSKAGAVLVCTLRGHAGVINNIDVSADNSFLATASEDGDCRVWGLSDGSPICLLRGHKGGANTVVWSRTPYRLVTAGGDGLARTWDIREACLKRYGKVIGKRPEYAEIARGNNSTTTTPVANNDAVALPPLPLREAEPAVPLPPLPRAGEPVGGPAVQDNDENVVIGRFVANDAIDEGVKLLSKLQHGAPQDRANLTATRSRRAPQVLCVARCPVSGHFATGSEDGMCRIWREDNDDDRVDRIDRKFSRDFMAFAHGKNGRLPMAHVFCV